MDVSWPEEAASWLRQAHQLVTPGPDLWILGGASVGLAQMVTRLAWSTTWQSHRTLTIGAAATSEAMRLAGGHPFEGMRGADPDGALWQVRDSRLQPLPSVEVERS